MIPNFLPSRRKPDIDGQKHTGRKDLRDVWKPRARTDGEISS